MIDITQPYGNPIKAKILIIGPDPRLQKSNTIAPFAFFANYYFRPKPLDSKTADKRKYDFAASVFNMMKYLTGGFCKPDEYLLTNLCNESLPHAPQGKTVLIPKDKALQGIKEIQKLLNTGYVKIVFAMSLQVNYWLQFLNFCSKDKQFIKESIPKDEGLKNTPPYYEAESKRTFQMVCGKRFYTKDNVSVYPILHAKQWPLEGNIERAYKRCYKECKKLIISELR